MLSITAGTAQPRRPENLRWISDGDDFVFCSVSTWRTRNHFSVIPVPGPREKSSFSGGSPNYYKEGEAVVDGEVAVMQVYDFSQALQFCSAVSKQLSDFSLKDQPAV